MSRSSENRWFQHCINLVRNGGLVKPFQELPEELQTDRVNKFYKKFKFKERPRNMFNKDNPKIQFSHSYIKLEGIYIKHPVTLMEVFLKDAKELSSKFVDYDTKWYDGKTVQWYELPKSGELIILLFSDFKQNLFTTVRSRFGKENQDKYAYYKGLCGREFDVIIKEV